MECFGRGFSWAAAWAEDFACRRDAGAEKPHDSRARMLIVPRCFRLEMAFGPLLQRILVLVSASLIQASNVSLDGEVGSFIPSCAIDCFESFIDLNRLSTGCGTRPSLQCLCSHETSSGLTIGEGALECIVSEDSLGACQEAEASSQSVPSCA